jgi:hypothetical protein
MAEDGSVTMYKGAGPKKAKYAYGGAAVTTRSRFMKAPATFCDDNEPTDYDKKGKGGSMSKLQGDSKSLKPIKPRT